MQIGKYSVDQLLKMSVFDKNKVKFGFWGILIGMLVYFVFQGIAISFLPQRLPQIIVLSLGDFITSLIIISTVIGLSFSIKNSLGGKKKAIPVKKLVAQSAQKLPMFVGIVVLYILAIVLILSAESLLYLLGKVPVWGALILGLGTIPLVIFNLILVVIVVFGVKLLPVFLINESGKAWGSFVKLNKLIINNIVKLVAYFSLAVLSIIPFALIIGGLFGAASYMTSFVQRAAFQKIIFAGGIIEWPSVLFGLFTGISYLVITVLAVSYLVVYSVAALYSIYLAIKTK